MPIELAQDPLPEQFTLPAEVVSSVIAVLEWLNRQPEWFDLRDAQQEQIDNWLQNRLELAPEWRALSEEQTEWLWSFDLKDGGLVVVADEVDGRDFPVVGV